MQHKGESNTGKDKEIMSRIMKCICDGCGAEIEKLPAVVHVTRTDLETGESAIDEEAGYYHSNKEYCEGCMNEIVECMERLHMHAPASKKSEGQTSDEENQGVVKKKRAVSKRAD